MNKYYIFSFVLLTIVGGYFYLSINSSTSVDTDQSIQPGAQIVESGTVIDVNLDGVALDGPGLVSLKTPSGDNYTIAVPSMGIRLCAATNAIASPFSIEVGDQVDVRGTVNEELQIVPCEDGEDYLRVMRTYTNTEIGFSFQYPAGEAGYVFEDDMIGFSEHPDFVYGIMLTDWWDYEAFHNSTDAREGPPTMQVRVIENTDNLLPAVWVDRNPMEANTAIAFDEPRETVVGGAHAVTYISDGLFTMPTYVVAYGGHIFLFVGNYITPDSDIATDFKKLVSTVRFVPTNDQLNDGTHIGFISSVSDNNDEVVFDVAQWLTGEPAENAAIRSGFCTESDRGECLPNGYFIENEEKTSVALPINDDTLIFMQTWKMEETGTVTEREIGLSDFGVLINSDEHWNQLPYEVTVLDGQVNRIEEVYIP